MPYRTEKTPTEKIPLQYDFVDDIKTAGQVADGAASSVVVLDPTGLDMSGTMLISWSVTGFRLAAFIQGGVNGTTYTVNFTLITTSGLYRLEGYVQVYVRNN